MRAIWKSVLISMHGWDQVETRRRRSGSSKASGTSAPLRAPSSSDGESQKCASSYEPAHPRESGSGRAYSPPSGKKIRGERRSVAEPKDGSSSTAHRRSREREQYISRAPNTGVHLVRKRRDKIVQRLKDGDSTSPQSRKKRKADQDNSKLRHRD